MARRKKSLTGAAKKKAKLKQSKTEFFKRPRGRAPKNTKWNPVSGKYEPYNPYPQATIKVANERLRKLEKVLTEKAKAQGFKSMAESSEAYQEMLKYAESMPKTKGRIYNQELLKEGKLRFIGKKEYEKLSEEEKAYFVERMNAFLANKSSTTSGILKAHDQSYYTFMSKYGKNYPNLTKKQYFEFWEKYNVYVNLNNEHYSYTDVTRVLKFVRLDTALHYNQLDKVMSLVSKNKWDEIDSRFLLRT